MLRISHAFAPVLAANGGGALLNVLSIASWISGPLLAGYAASKSAAWCLTNGLRHELRAQQTQVLALHMAFVDTDLTHGIDAPEVDARATSSPARSTRSKPAPTKCWPTNCTQQVKQGLSARRATCRRAAERE